MSLKRAGPNSPPDTPLPAGIEAPWASNANLRMAITAGSGGTDFVAIQLAIAWGAANIITAATDEGMSFCASLGTRIRFSLREIPFEQEHKGS
jgi:NADPH:quinone reductase-like Zn-dependent oxidoreductase